MCSKSPELDPLEEEEVELEVEPPGGAELELVDDDELLEPEPGEEEGDGEVVDDDELWSPELEDGVLGTPPLERESIPGIVLGAPLVWLLDPPVAPSVCVVVALPRGSVLPL